jgi:hypothetical protein
MRTNSFNTSNTNFVLTVLIILVSIMLFLMSGFVFYLIQDSNKVVTIVLPTSVPDSYIQELRNEIRETCFNVGSDIVKTQSIVGYDYIRVYDEFIPFCVDDYVSDVLSNQTSRGVLNLEN